MTAAPSSPLARLRASYEERQKAGPARYVDLWGDGGLVAQVARTEDIQAATSLTRTMGAIVNPAVAESLEITADTLADILAAATVGLFERQPDGSLEPLPGANGQPLTFGPEFGAAIGVPEITTPRAAVIAAFTEQATEDAPPTLDTLRLITAVTATANTLTATRTSAQAVVGKASPTPNGATPQ